MKIVSENFRDLHALYVNQLRLLLSAEEQIVRALPDMMNAATDEQLSEAFRTHYQETDVHVKRLEELLAKLKSMDAGIGSISPIRCKAVHALIAESEDMQEDARDAFVKDAALIASAQRIEHYEIAAYGAVRQFAWVMGDNEAADVLDLTIKEEGNADHVLTSIAERINVDAKHGRDARSTKDRTAA
jgi:ferritin-like metal-binding protein YciE